MKHIKIETYVKLPDNFSEAQINEAIASIISKHGGQITESYPFKELDDSNDGVYVICYDDKYEIVVGDDAMQIRVSELDEAGFGPDEDVMVFERVNER